MDTATAQDCHPRRSKLRSWWHPSTGFFVVLLIGLLWAGREKMLRDPGTMWHTVVGQRICETGRLIQTDPFSFTQQGQAWIAQQWLGECAMAIVHRFAGLDGLVLAAAAILAGTFAFLVGRFMRAGLQWPAATILLVLVIAAGSYHFIPRPHLITILLFALLTALLCDVEAGTVSSRRLLWLPPLFVFWTNVHGGALGGIATVFIVQMAWLLRGVPKVMRIDGDARVRPMLIATSLSLSFVAVLVNPYGTALPRVWLSLMNSDLLPRLMIEHAPLRFLSTEGLMILTLAAVYLGLLAATWRRGLRVTWLVPLIWLVLACSRVRHGPLFAVTAAVAIADMLPHSPLPAIFARSSSTLLNPARAAKAGGLRVVAIPALLVALVFGVQAAGFRCPLIGAGWCRLDPAYWPVEATKVLREHLATRPEDRRVFNDMLFGGYLIYNAPEARVYIDDRCELYRDSGLTRYVELRDHPERIEGLAGSKAPHLALVRSRSPLRRYLEDSPNWSVLHQDPTASLFLRKPH